MKILLVDDTDLFLDLQKSYLDRSSFSILTARSGPEALAVIRADHPQLVVLDLLMPGMDGDAVCRMIKSDPLTNTIPVIMLSSVQDNEQRERCLSAGCDAFVPKPLKRDNLLEAIEKTIVIARRRYPRIPTHLLSDVTYGSKSKKMWIHTISKGGIFLEADPAPEVGEELQVTFTLPGTDEKFSVKTQVKWKGRVREDSPHGVGCQFTQIENRLAEIIQNYVNEKLSSVGSLKGFA